MAEPVPLSVVPRPELYEEYDAEAMEYSFQALELDLSEKFDRRSNLILDPGKELVLTADDSSSMYGLGIDSSGYLRLLDYSDGSVGTFTVAWSQVDGASQEITDLTAYVDAADATLTSSVSTNATAIAANGVSIATISTELTAAREGEASLLANITDVRTAFASADTAIAADVTVLSAEVTTARDGEASLTAKLTSIETAFATADTAEATSRAALEARVDTERSLQVVRKTNFEDGLAGGWTATVVSGSDTLYDNEARFFARDNVETPYIYGDFGARVYRVTGRAWNGTFSYTLSAGLICFDKDDTLTGAPVITARAGLASWGAFEGDVTVPADTVRMAPFVLIDGDAGTVAASGDYASVSSLEIEDITVSDGLDTRLTTAEADIVTEQSVRATADTAEATARTALQATLESADTTLQSNIDAEASTRSTADSTAATDRAAIRSEFAAADTTLQANVDAEASTRATADTAEATARTAAVATLNGQLGAGNNLLPNSTFEEAAPAGASGAPRGWSSANTGGTYNTYVTGSGTFDTWRPTGERSYAVEQTDATSAVIHDTRTGKVYVEPGKNYEYSVYTGAHRCTVQVLIEFYDSSDVGVGTETNATSNTGGSAGGTALSSWQRIGGVVEAPATASYALLNLRKNGTSSGSNSYMFITRPMIAEALDDQTGISPYVPSAGEISALTSVMQRALVDSSGDAIAQIVQEAAAGGGDPTRIGLRNGSDGSSDIALVAKQIFFGSDTVFEDTHDTIYTETGGYRTRILGPFGSSSDCLLWFGPDSVALNSETTSNGDLVLATDGLHIKLDLNGATVSNSTPSGSAPSANAAATSDSTTVTPTGGDGTYTYSWAKVQGASISANSASAATTTFTGTPGQGNTIEATMRCTVTETSSGNKAQIDVFVSLIDLNP